MRKEIENWIKQGKEEFDTAEVNFKNHKYFSAAFWCQQSIEKLLKALYILKKRSSPESTHSLSYLGREINAPKEFWKFLKDLSAQYYVSRYPDATEDVPYLTYTKEEVQDYLNKAKEFIKWLDLQIKKY